LTAFTDENTLTQNNTENKPLKEMAHEAIEEFVKKERQKLKS
jgi:hypothetical protein